MAPALAISDLRSGGRISARALPPFRPAASLLMSTPMLGMFSKILLDTIFVKHMMGTMAKHTTKQKRLACGYIAGEALLYVGGDRLAVRTRGVHPRNVSSNLALRTKWD